MNEQNGIFYEILFAQPLYLISDKHDVPHADKRTQQSILVVVTSLPLAPAEEELLHKILQAAKINPAALDKITIADYRAEENSNRHHILFFVKPDQLPKELAVFGMYCAAPAYEKAHVIIANDLTLLATDTAGKRQLWELLKQTFLQ
jgi:hypothetical protein